MQTNQYKEQNYPTWNLVKELNKKGQLNKAQAAFAAAEKPIEELYDVQADPDEARNLAQDLAQKKTLMQLRALVDGFVRENDGQVTFEDPLDIYRGYWGHLPEDSVV
jgi:arylsulfatase A-like enzyme